ncbi:MerR family transcriptional regulator [Microbacterium sp.]|uniref:MerR family transcriptional regulator n=1 Tax=Microbacterium sp. TaxID=51671 RepID=UPI0028112BCC|nr:MerR family transcriptional regulator [Microbacterium sp.]
MDWSIQQIAKLAGTTSRALRHYGDIGLLPPSRTGANGYRYYDERALVRLQRILLLRDLGLGLTQISAVLARETDERRALEAHLEWLRGERERIGRQIAAVTGTIRGLEEQEELMAEKMFDGFDHTPYKQEVEQRWGADAYARGDAWWRGMSDDDRRGWQERAAALAHDWAAAAAEGVDPASERAQELARRHVGWLRGIPGTPAGDRGDVKGYVQGLADMYVADERFARNYGGVDGAAFVRDALRIHAERSL